MPKHYRPGLLALPFHTLPATGTTTAAAAAAAAAATPDTNGAGDDHGWSDEQARVLNSAVAFLERPETATQLLAELEALRAGGEMRVEQECIHEAGGGRGTETCFLRCCHFIRTKNDLFTKTGSGQTQGNTLRKNTATTFLQGSGGVMTRQRRANATFRLMGAAGAALRRPRPSRAGC